MSEAFDIAVVGAGMAGASVNALREPRRRISRSDVSPRGVTTYASAPYCRS
jgi:hypothetical protein